MERARERRHRERQRGFTYLWLLFALAVVAAGLAALGERAGQATLRDKEAELRFRGEAIAVALAAYSKASPAGTSALPKTLADLVEDKRGLVARRHLRRVYTDPFTGLADWVLITAEDGQIEGVHSRSGQAAVKTADLPPVLPGQTASVSSLIFRHDQVVPPERKPEAAASSAHE